MNHLTESVHSYKDFGWANSWREKPEIIEICNHKTTKTTIRQFVHEVRCDVCRYKYVYDSS